MRSKKSKKRSNITTKPGITYERHQVIGHELSVMYNRMVSLSVEIANAYPRSGSLGRPYMHVRKVNKALSSLRCALEDHYVREYPDDWEVKTYYGQIKK